MDAYSCRSEGETTWSSTINIIGPSCRFLAAPTDAALLRRHSWATCGSFPNKSMRRWDSIFGQMYDINPQDGPLPDDFELFGFSENPGKSIYKIFFNLILFVYKGLWIDDILTRSIQILWGLWNISYSSLSFPNLSCDSLRLPGWEAPNTMAGWMAHFPDVFCLNCLFLLTKGSCACKTFQSNNGHSMVGGAKKHSVWLP